jgi:hypothetical protein
MTGNIGNRAQDSKERSNAYTTCTCLLNCFEHLVADEVKHVGFRRY